MSTFQTEILFEVYTEQTRLFQWRWFYGVVNMGATTGGRGDPDLPKIWTDPPIFT